MSEIAADPGIIDVEEFYEYPPERVWEALTTPALMARWLLEPTGFAPVVGTRFTFGEIVCEVITVRATELLSIAWADAGTDWPGGWVVTWLVHPEGSGTRVTLRHKGFDPHDEEEQRVRTVMGRGWVRTAKCLGEVLDGTI
ncbi:SRPBCC domain-containing protein [soil metagenome]